MKKNVKNLTLLSLLALMGCANNKNIVTDATMKRAVLRDVKTGRERVYDASNDDAMKMVLIWLAPGDTVTLRSHDYARGTFFTPENSQLLYNDAELARRKDLFEREKIRQMVKIEFAKQEEMRRQIRNNNQK
ncbi:MAG: hypothetical protein IJQ90_03685 [Alphaproteobacteria bacterium]|nr:hypothetical protein [Alphaproteobacteria bacterium]